MSLLVHFILAEGEPGRYFAANGDVNGGWREVWLGGGVVGEALSGYVLGWAGVGGVIR